MPRIKSGFDRTKHGMQGTGFLVGLQESIFYIRLGSEKVYDSAVMCDLLGNLNGLLSCGTLFFKLDFDPRVLETECSLKQKTELCLTSLQTEE